MDSQLQLMKMQEMYTKLYKKYSELKAVKFLQLDEANEEQEHKFSEFVSGADNLIEHLKTENKRMSDDIDELRKELSALRTAKDQEYDDLQQHLAEEKEKNRELFAENVLLRQFMEGPNPSNTNVSPGQLNESPMRANRSSNKRARPSMETNSPLHGVSLGPHELSTGKGSLSGRSRDVPTAYTQPECCQSSFDNEGPSKCLFHNLVECLTGMKVSVAIQPEGRGIRAIHEYSGYTFDLTWFNKAAQGEELLYQVSSLGTLSTIAPEWMRDAIIFSVSMCPVFFERVSHVIKGD